MRHRLPAVFALSCLLLGALLAPANLRAQENTDAATTLDPIVVSGTHAELEGSGVVLRVPVDPLAATDLADLLATLPGVQVRSSGGLGSYSEASLRGSSGRQVRLLLDGLPLDVGGGEATSLSLISPLLLEQVDVYQGRVPVNLASGAAGSINLRTRRTLAEPLVGTLGFGTLGERQISLGAQLSDAVQLLAGHQQAENDFRFVNPFKPFDPNDPDRSDRESRRNAATAQSYGLLRYRGPLVFSLHGARDEQELPTRLNRPGSQTSLETRSLGASIATPEDSEWRLSLSHRRTDERYLDLASELGPGSAQDVEQRANATQFGVGRQLGPLFNQLRLEHQEFSSHDALGDTGGPSARRLSIGDGIEISWGERWLLESSLHTAWSQDEYGGASDGEWRIEPALGLSHAVGSCLASGNLGQRKRLPTFFERYGDRGLFRGNPALEAERATYADAGLRCANTGPLKQASLIVFAQDLRDAISPTYTAQGVGRSINTEQAEILGIELASSGGSPDWGWSLSGTWQHTADRSDTRATQGNALPGRFENQLNAHLERRVLGLTLAYDFRFESGQFYDSASLLPADVMRRHDLSIRGVVRRIGWSLQWINVGNDNFEQFNGFPTPGERVRFSITWPEQQRAAAPPETRSES